MNRFEEARGFSLIEILVAFTIVTLSLTIIFQIYSKGTHAAILGNDYAQAIIIAESKLDEAGTILDLNVREQSGLELDKYTWNMQIDDFIYRGQAVTEFGLKQVQIEVSWESTGNIESLVVQTLKPFNFH